MTETGPPSITLLQRYIESDAVHAARMLQNFDEADSVSVIKELPPKLAAEIFPHLHGTYALEVLKQMSPGQFSIIVNKMDPEHAVDILLLANTETRQILLNQVPAETKKQIQELLSYPLNSAGRIISTNYIAFHEQTKVKDAIEKIRTIANRKTPVTYTYVVGPGNRLIGVLNMRDLLLAGQDAPVSSIMNKEVFSINGFMDREEVAQELHKRRLIAAPVVDSDNRLFGVVKPDQLIGDMTEEVTEDILKMAGVGGDEHAGSPLNYSMKKRLPWLHVNLATAFLAASVVALFEDTIAKVTVLAVFLPVVAGQGGNAGAQSLAVAMRALVMREIKPASYIPFILKEAKLGALNGIITGLITAIIAWLWHGNPFLGVVIGLAMIINLIAAGISGAGIPLLMKKLGFDPAQSSSIIMTTVTDVIGFFAFLGLAVVFMKFLI